ncbi:hypothetical protein BH09DEP1_BH09DEP1_0460 [soil metagenome]
MEPASTLAAIALAAATLVPPSIEITLQNWQNNRNGVINIYQCARPASYGTNYLVGIEGDPIASILPAYNQTPIVIPIKKNIPAFYTALLYLIPGDDLSDCIELFLAHSQEGVNSSLNIHCIARHKKSQVKELGLNIAAETMKWKTSNPPSSISIEIEGTVGTQWNNAQASIKTCTRMISTPEKLK